MTLTRKGPLLRVQRAMPLSQKSPIIETYLRVCGRAEGTDKPHPRRGLQLPDSASTGSHPSAMFPGGFDAACPWAFPLGLARLERCLWNFPGLHLNPGSIAGSCVT